MYAWRSKSDEVRLEARRLTRALLVLVGLGLIAGLAAVVFTKMVGFVQELVLEPLLTNGQVDHLGELTWPTGSRWWLLVVPTVGGLLSGVLCARYAPEAMGAGVGNVIDAYHRRHGKIRRRVPLVKSIASTLTIGSGGSAGMEGPIGQICAGIGSWVSGLLKLGPQERKVLVMTGFAAGIGAVFQAPMAAAIFAAEVLYREVDLEHVVLVPAIIASTVAYALYTSIVPASPVIILPHLTFAHGLQLVPYSVMALLLAAGALLFIGFFSTLQSKWGFAPGLRLWLRPTLGGLGVGLIGLWFPLAIGGGYHLAQWTIDGNIGVAMLMVLAVAKIMSTTLTAGMGGSGGLFGPSLVIGGVLGGAVGQAAAQLAPGLDIEPAAFVVVGMAGFFASVANAPLSTVIMVAEMVGSYELVVPTLWVCVLAWALNRKRSVYPQQVPTRLDAPSQMADMMGAVLHRISVGDAADLDPEHVVTVRPNMKLHDIVQTFSDTTQAIFPIVGADGKLRGVVDGRLLRRTLGESGFDDLMIADDFFSQAVTVKPSDSLHTAVSLMMRNAYDTLLVVDEDDPLRLAGVLSRREVVATYHKRMLAAAPGMTKEHDLPIALDPDLEEVPRDDFDPGDLAGALERGGVHTGLVAETAEEALQQLVLVARLPAECDRELLLERLIEREHLSNTGVGDGIALPHPSVNDVGIETPRVVLGFLTKPVDWHAYDEVPVDTVFLLLARTGDDHLALLARMARAVSDPTLRKLLQQRAPEGDILRRVRELAAGAPGAS